MYISLFLTVFLSVFSAFGQGERLSVQGYFQGTNLLISNPPQKDGFGFCVIKVTVNGEILPATTQKRVFEVNFSNFNLKNGDPVFVVLEHAIDCTPSFLNPQCLKPRSTFSCEKISITETGILHWQTKNEDGKLDFVIEQFRWGKWVEVGSVLGKGQKAPNDYQFLVNLHSGKNQIRVSQYDNSGVRRSTKEVFVISKKEEVFKSAIQVKNRIEFTSNSKSVKTKYEVYDAYANLLKMGFGASVDCSNLVNGLYYINYDNKSEKFFKVN